MQIRKVDRKYEKQIIIGMIVDRSYLAQISSSFSFDYMKNSYAKTIAKWCLDYFEKYDNCPFDKIQDLFEYETRKGNLEGDDVDLIESLLEEVSEDYKNNEKINRQFLLDKTQEYFNRVRLENLRKDIDFFLEEDDLDGAEMAVIDSKEIRLTASKAIDPFTDKEKVQEAFKDVAKPLFKVAGHFGDMINEQLTRAAFLAIQAPEKTGKTWMLYWLAKEALAARLKVVIFQVGDMTEAQSIIRMAIMNSGKSNKKRYCGEFKSPVKFVKFDGEDDAMKECMSAPKGYDLKYKMIDIKNPLGWKEALKNNKEFYAKHRLKKEKNFRLVTVPANTLNMKGIDSHLDKLHKQDDFIADVVVVDYMDILSAENSKDIGTRDKINNNWIEAKSVCNKRNILLISATQADANSYDGELQGRDNFSEDKRKYAHVNGTLGLSQSNKEKEDGLIRLNWIVLREGEFSTSRPCYVAQSLRRGLPVCASLIPYWKEGYRQPEEKEKQPAQTPKASKSKRGKSKRGR